jgi:hypothetical protein
MSSSCVKPRIMTQLELTYYLKVKLPESTEQGTDTHNAGVPSSQVLSSPVVATVEYKSSREWARNSQGARIARKLLTIGT